MALVRSKGFQDLCDPRELCVNCFRATDQRQTELGKQQQKRDEF